MLQVLLVLFTFITSATTIQASAAAKGLEIASRVDAYNANFKTEVADVKMQLIDAKGAKVNRELKMSILEIAQGDKSLIEFKSPSDIRGTKLLTWSHKKGKDDQWLYLKAIKRVKRISSNNKTASFVGSEFSYEDLAGSEVERFTYEYLGDVKLNGRIHWKVARFPVDKNSGYAKQVVYVDKGYMAPSKMELYNKRNELEKVATSSGFSKFGKYWRPSQVEMSNIKTKKKSLFIWESRKIGASIDKDDFRSQSLKD